MSVYGNSIKTHIIDPVYYRDNFRAEFRLNPDTVYYSNMRVGNLGSIGTTGNGLYNGLTGAYGIIRSIHLYDKNQLLDQVLEFPRFMGFKNYNKSNQTNMDLRNNLSKARVANAFLGFDIQGAGGNTMRGAKIQEWDVKPSATGTLPATLRNSQAWLDLKEVFPLLKSMASLDTSVFKNLKVVIEFNTDLNEFLRADNDTNVRTYEPRLFVDEIISPNEKSAMEGFKGVSYVSIEHDRANIRAIAPPADANAQGGDIDSVNVSPTQSTTLHINGFNNKTIGKMLIMKSPTLLASYKTGNNNHRNGKHASQTYHQEKLQVRVNGASLFAGAGIEHDSKRLALLNDSWGKCSSFPFCSSDVNTEADVGNLRGAFILSGNNDYGQLDYYGFVVNQAVGDLQIDFSRVGVFQRINQPQNLTNDNNATRVSTYNQAIELNIYCEVYKQIVPNGKGGYSVSYQ